MICLQKGGDLPTNLRFGAEFQKSRKIVFFRDFFNFPFPSHFVLGLILGFRGFSRFGADFQDLALILARFGAEKLVSRP